MTNFILLVMHRMTVEITMGTTCVSRITLDGRTKNGRNREPDCLTRARDRTMFESRERKKERKTERKKNVKVNEQ